MKTTCPICGTEFEKKKWNSTYCPDKDCYDIAKRKREKEYDDLIKSIQKGIKNNFKLFSNILPSNGTASIGLIEAYKQGFDQNAFYKTAKDLKTDILWYACGPYFFCISNNSGVKELTIYK